MDIFFTFFRFVSKHAYHQKNVIRQGHDNKPVQSGGSCADPDQ